MELVTRLARLIVRDHHLAEDAAQEAFLRAWKGMRRLDSGMKFEAWMRRITVNACFDTLRKERAWRAPPRPMPFAIGSEHDAIEEVAVRDEVGRAFGQLSAEHRAVLVLRYYLGLAPAEIAAAMGVPAGTVRSRLHYGLRELRSALDTIERVAHKEAPTRGRRRAL